MLFSNLLTQAICRQSQPSHSRAPLFQHAAIPGCDCSNTFRLGRPRGASEARSLPGEETPILATDLRGGWHRLTWVFHGAGDRGGLNARRRTAADVGFSRRASEGDEDKVVVEQNGRKFWSVLRKHPHNIYIYRVGKEKSPRPRGHAIQFHVT